MPNKPISMTKIRQVLRCYAAEMGSKSISRVLGMSRTTVKKYLHIFQTCGKSYEEIQAMDDGELFSLFQEKSPSTSKPEYTSPRKEELQKLLPEYAKRLKKRGWTKERLYMEYLEKSKTPYARSQFMEAFRRYEVLSNPVAHISHKAGDKMYVDYAGDKLELLCDKETGDIIEDRYGKKTTILTSQVPVKNWYDLIGDKTVADAILDRLVHNALRIELHGESLRKLHAVK